ncbi:hypothetical protein BGZ65_005622, partial [Modicella reniformis]
MSVIFGVDLVDAIRISHIPDTPLVPAVLYRCAEFLEAKGVDEVGLYRVPGSHANVQKLKQMFDTGKDYDLFTMDAIDPNDIATLLKLYLRELPSPLMPAALLEQFQSLLTTDREICQTLRGILLFLPRPSYIVLSYLCHHLCKIAAHSDKTKMTVSNLALIFAPTLAVGNLLFKALLGAFYEGGDTPENREKGLQVVWGEQPQNPEANTQEGSEDDTDTQCKVGVFGKEEYEEPTMDQDQIFQVQQLLPAHLLIREQDVKDDNVTDSPPVFRRGIGPLELDDHSRNRLPLADPVSPSIHRNEIQEETEKVAEARLADAMLQPEYSSPVTSTILGSEGLENIAENEEWKLINAMLERETTETVSSLTISIESSDMVVDNEERRLMMAMLLREAAEPVSLPTRSSECFGKAAENEESKLMYAMLQREEMAVKSGLASSPRSSFIAAGPSSKATLAVTRNPPTHLTLTATVPGDLIAASTASNEFTTIAELSFSSLSVDVPSLTQSADALNITIDASAIPTTPIINTGVGTRAGLQEPLPSKNISSPLQIPPFN